MDALQRGWLNEMLRFVPLVRETYDPATKRIRAQRWSERYQWPMYPLAFLYKTRLEGNPHFGDTAIRDIAVGMGDGMLSFLTKEGMLDDGEDQPTGEANTSEWPLFYLAGTAEVLGDELPAASRERWGYFARSYAAYLLPRPFFFTAPNHEAWRCAAIARAAKAFGFPDAAERARFLIRALADYQTPEGFWEEGRHHSVSTAYNHVMVSGQYAFHRAVPDDAVRGMLEKLLGFVTEWTHPDGATLGCLDGRMSWQPAPKTPGLGVTPRGRRLRGLCAANARLLGTDDPQGEFYEMSNWNAHAKVAAACENFRSYEPGDEEALPVERDGFLKVVHSGTFDGAIHRRGPWNAAVSGIVSDIPVGASSPYRLSRENRIDLWHAKAGLVLGGGNSPAPAEVQNAWVHVATGFQAGCDFGKLSGELKTRQALYFPRAAKAFAEPGRAGVRLTFAHARVTITVLLEDDAHAEVRFDVEANGTGKLCLQLPFVAMHDAEVRAGGQVLPYAPDEAPAAVPAGEAVEIREAVYGATKRLRPPPGIEAKVRYPIAPMRSYRGLENNERYRNVFDVGLLCAEVPAPAGRASWSFRVEIEA